MICETAHEFYESLVNPFSERFMWRESTVRGRTWSHLDDVVLRERYDYRTCFPYRKTSTFNNGVRGESGAAAKGLKLILLHNSHYGHNNQWSISIIVVSSFQVSHINLKTRLHVHHKEYFLFCFLEFNENFVLLWLFDCGIVTPRKLEYWVNR